MVTQNIRKPKPLIIAIISVISFFIGNRLALLYMNYESETFFVAIAKVLDDFLPSLSFSQFGIRIDLDSFCISLGLGFLIIANAIYFYNMTMRKNFKIGAEHGSARYGTPKEAAALKDSDEHNNMLFSQNVHLSMDTRKTFLNNNVMWIGGSGSGKSRYGVKPNLLQRNTNYIFTDPKGKLIIQCGEALVDDGYEIKILNLNELDKSMGYNPYYYCKNATDIMKLINNLIENTGDQNRKSPDEFWDKAGAALLMALSFLILGTDYPTNQNIPRLMYLMDLMEAKEDDDDAEDVIDVVFSDLQEEVDAKLKSGDHKLVIACKNSYEYLACRQYTLYKKAAGKTAKSILITLGAKLAVFNLPQLDDLLQKDELNLLTIGNPKIREGKEDAPDSDPDKYVKTALFVCIEDSDPTFTFLAAIIYQQLFNLLYRQADATPDGRLPIPTRFMLDEFANTGKIPDFEKKIATMRSRNISVDVLLQNLSQLKGMYKDEQWETIYGNCDTTIFLGGKEFSTLEYLSKTIGKTTIDYVSVQETKGSNGSWSRSNQLIQRELIAPDEIKRLKPNECLIDIRGCYIFRDKKYDLLKHPNYGKTGDADKSLIFNPQGYITDLRNRGTLNESWYIDPANQDASLKNLELYDFTQEELEAYMFE